MMWKLFSCLVLYSSLCVAQDNSRRIKLAPELNEISGLALLNDTVLIAINDSGNTPDIFFLSLDGSIIKKTRVSSAENTDWEDITMDNQGNLYIADVGNNANNRKDLHFLKVDALKAFENEVIIADEISFSYEDQNEFPPLKSNLNFNCEAVFWDADSLYLLTKNESKEPKEKNEWNRNPSLYVMPTSPGSYVAHKTDWKSKELFNANESGISDLITSSVVRDNKWYILTYRHLFVSAWSKQSAERQVLYHKKFSKLKQREALTVDRNATIYIGAEKHKLLGGPYLYIRKL